MFNVRWTYRLPGPGVPPHMRQTLQSLFGFDLPTAQKWVIAFGVILVLLVLLGLFARQIKDGRLRIKGQGGGRTRQPRLGVVDIHDLDRQRQLVLIRRDNVEHLVMIGGASDVVVETNIVRSGARAMPAQPDLGAPERPLPFDSLLPQEPVRHEPAEDARRGPPPAPVALAPQGVEALQPPARSVPRQSQPMTQAEAAMAAGVAAGSLAAVAIAATGKAQAAPPPVVQAPSFTRDHAPAPSVSAGELDDMARQLDEALKRPFSAVRPSQAPAPAPVEPEMAPADPAPPPFVAPVEPPPVVVPPVVLAPVVLPPAPAAAPARPAPLDVAAELEMALGLKPERTAPRPPPFGAPVFQAPAEPAPVVEPVRIPEPEPKSLVVAPEPEPDAVSVPEPETEPQMGEDEAETIESRDQADAVPDAEVPVAPAPAEPEPEPAPKAIDPFSVDAIEAEFARLLGRDPKPRG